MRPKFIAIGSRTILLLAALALSACSAGVASAQGTSSGGNPAAAAVLASTSYTIVDTGQTHCYNNTQQIVCPQSGAVFFGQDAQFAGNQSSYTLSADGLTVSDNNTGLTWQTGPDTNGDGSLTAIDKLTYAQAQARPDALNAAKFGGYSDWRLPTIKELYSLIDFNGTDPNPTSTDTSGLKPFIDTNYFKFAYGQTSTGERIIDSQWATSTTYAANKNQMFGVNFADGRIKGYGTTMPGSGQDKTFFVLCVRGNTSYGVNNFVSNGDSTVTDNATGLMWSQTDSGKGMNWEAALAWAQTKNVEKYLGYSDWRLPNANELQSIVDYKRSPDLTNSAAIDPVFSVTSITNEAGKTDYPFYWTSTTHASANGAGETAVYIAFGRAMGHMNNTWVDVHGAGAQRSDPKNGNPSDYATGRGPQGDSIHINNYVRLVRGGNVTFTADTAAPAAPTGQPSGQGQPPMGGQGQQGGQGQPPMGGQGQQGGQGQPPMGGQGQGQLPRNQNGVTSNRTGGRVTAVNGNTILVENPEGTAAIVVNSSTKFTSNGQTSNLANVTIGRFIDVVGQKQTDGSWLAAQVTISDRPPLSGGPQSGQGLPPMGVQGQQPGQAQPPMGGLPPAGR